MNARAVTRALIGTCALASVVASAYSVPAVAILFLVLAIGLYLLERPR